MNRSVVLKSCIRLGAAGAGALALAGCALLSTPDPVQTYRFGGQPMAAVEPTASAPVPVTLRRIEFPQATEGDRILGVTGVETAYIAGARWISDARDLYTESLEGAFAAQSSRVRLTGFRGAAPATYSLALDVRAFEARYAVPGAAPTVVVSVRARLMSSPRREVAAERAFTVEQPATANRIGAIVEAFDIAVRDINTQIVAWTDASVDIAAPR